MLQKYQRIEWTSCFAVNSICPNYSPYERVVVVKPVLETRDTAFANDLSILIDFLEQPISSVLFFYAELVDTCM